LRVGGNFTELHEMKEVFTLIIFCFTCNLCLSQKFIRYEKTNIDFDNSYFNLTKEQEKTIELYLIAKSQFSLIRDYPPIIGIDKEGNVFTFDKYKDLYNECEKEKCIWKINLFYMEFLRMEKGKNLMAYTVLEPDWYKADETKSDYLYGSYDETKKNKLFSPIRCIRQINKINKYNQKYTFFYINDYGE